jgi:pimeloyl-ACP methyl ester carboxylesterase
LSDPLINTLWDEQIAAFDTAIAALPNPGKRLQVLADNFTVEAIWYTASNETQKRPTLILCEGYDGSQEDMYHTMVVPALARGWNALTFEGPGQPLVRRKQNLGFIPDWERVVTPLVDYLLNNKSQVVDSSRLVLFGYSFGGYLAARAAAFEPRLSAVMLDGGVWDAYTGFASSLTPEQLGLFNAGNKTAFDTQILAIESDGSVPTSARWGLEQGLWSFNTKSPFDFLTMSKQYTVKDIINRIQVPVWIADGEYESFYPGQAETVKNALGDNATLHVFQGVAGYHCQGGALQEMVRIVFGWLNKTLN